MSQTEAEKIHQDILRKMTFAQKWEQACGLRETAWKIKAAGVRLKHPDWNEKQVEAEVRKIFLYATT
jgi:hypothetical protein